MAGRSDRWKIAVVVGLVAVMAALVVVASGLTHVEFCWTGDADAPGSTGGCTSEVRWQLW